MRFTLLIGHRTHRSWLSRSLLASVLLVTAARGVENPSPGAERPGAEAGSRVSGSLFVYVGTYTRGESRGIHILRLDLQTGALSAVGVRDGVVNPSFLALHPDRPYLYAVNEISRFRDERSGAVSAFSLDPATGQLKLLNQASSGGAAPCHLVVDPTGRNLLVANYSGGSVAVLRILEDGRLGEIRALVQHEGSSVDPGRQRGPHAHGVILDGANRRALVADLGLDKVLLYRFEPTEGTLVPADPPAVGLTPGAGPRHLALSPDGRWLYVINELDSTLAVFSRSAAGGALRKVQTVSTLPDDHSGQNSTAEVVVHPTGRFVYGSNRGHDSIAVFAVGPGDGRLRLVEHEPTGGRTPRNFGIAPGGTWLLAANQDSDNVVTFRIDPESGRLESSGHSATVPTPVCVVFLGPGR